jgi:hypothetical protein
MGVAGPGSARGFVGALADVTAALASHKPVVGARGRHPPRPLIGDDAGPRAMAPAVLLRTVVVPIVVTGGVAEKVGLGECGGESGPVEEGCGER